MRILLAVDGSISSDRARDLVSTLPLPEGSQLRLVAVDRHAADLLGLSWAALGPTGTGVPSQETEAQIASRHLREALSRAETLLERPGITVEALLLRGRAATAIVDEAVAFGADLVVLGSRGHGAIASMLLGSTAAEVVDHAPCPVLVARAGEVGEIAFADDGSPAARLAERFLATWPIFAGRQVDVVTPTPEGLRFVRDRSVGLTVLGTRGHTGLTRMMLGSVARTVLLHGSCSVLIVRQAARLGNTSSPETVEAARR